MAVYIASFKLRDGQSLVLPLSMSREQALAHAKSYMRILRASEGELSDGPGAVLWRRGGSSSARLQRVLLSVGKLSCPASARVVEDLRIQPSAG